MKNTRLLAAFLCLTLLLTLLAPGALANAWGLKSGLMLDAVSRVHTYDEYTALAQVKVQDGEVAVLASRYHAVLLYAYQFNGELRLEASHTAVKQPDEKGYKKVKLQAESPGFVLKYSDMELHFFPLVGNLRRTYTLQSGRIGELTLQPGGVNSESTGWLTCSEGENTVDWFVGDEGVPTLTQLNLRLFPRTIDALIAMLELRNVIAPQCFDDDELAPGEEMPGDAGAATVPVYSAPSEDSVRFAKGKASVNLREPARFYGLSQDGNWALVEYEVSDRTSRFGYVKRSDLPGSVRWTYTITSIDMPLTVTQDTFLTDDPDVSQYQQMTLKAGSGVRLLAFYDIWYAYVETTLDGKAVRGFVPRSCLRCAMPDQRASEAEARLVGQWECLGGGEVLAGYVTFQEDGRAGQSWLPLAEMETTSDAERQEYGETEWNMYEVYYCGERAHFWGPCEYVLVLRGSAGQIMGFYGMDFGTDAEGREEFDLLFGEGGTGYARYEAGEDGVNG